jgi:hypothetical protein
LNELIEVFDVIVRGMDGSPLDWSPCEGLILKMWHLLWKSLIFQLQGFWAWSGSGLIEKVWWQYATLFVYFSYFITFIHSFNHIHTIHLSIAEASLHFFIACLLSDLNPGSETLLATRNSLPVPY